MTNHTERLREAGAEYEHAKKAAEALLTRPRKQLVEYAREAYRDGMKKADILRAIGYVWSNTWLDKILRGVERNPTTGQPTDG